MAVKRVIVDAEEGVAVTLDGIWVEIETDGVSLFFEKREAEKVANAMLTVLNKTRRDDE